MLCTRRKLAKVLIQTFTIQENPGLLLTKNDQNGPNFEAKFLDLFQEFRNSPSSGFRNPERKRLESLVQNFFKTFVSYGILAAQLIVSETHCLNLDMLNNFNDTSSF